MPTTKIADKLYIIDCSGLVGVSHTANNALRSRALQLLDAGKMKVASATKSEFRDAFEEEFDDLAAHIETPIRVKPAHHLMVATLATKANSTFKIEPYGSSDWLAAAVAVCEDGILVTTRERLTFYTSILTCQVIHLGQLPI